jgi:hypothetical protein
MTFDLFHLFTLAGLLLAAALVLLSWPAPFYRKLPYAYFLLYGVLVSFFQPIGQLSVYSQASQASGARFVVCLALVPLAVKLFPRFLSVFALWIITLDALWAATSMQGLFIGTTQSTLVAAIFFPLLVQDKVLRFGAPFVLASIIYTQGMASYGVLLVHAFFFLFTTRFYSLALGVPLAGLAALTFWFPKEQFLAGDRINNIWAPAFHFWYAKCNWWVGTGPMSYEWLSPLFGAPRMWMHSDWLQIFFETGAVGLACSILLFMYAMWEVRCFPILLGILVSLGVGMAVYSPMQFFVVWVLAIWTVRFGPTSKCV